MGHDPQIRVFLFLVSVSQKLRPKSKKPESFAHKRNMMFADGLETEFYPSLVF